jgi:hypothetical protein
LLWRPTESALQASRRLVALYADPRVSRYLSLDGQPWPRERSVAVFEHFVRLWELHPSAWGQEEFPYKGGVAVWYALDRGRWQARMASEP